MFCTNCQYHLPSDAAFCAKCGKAVGTLEATASGKPLYEDTPAPIPRPSHAGRTILIGLGVVAVLWFGITVGNGGSGTPGAVSPYRSAPAPSLGHTISYRVSGTTGFASLTYNNAQGGSEQIDTVRVPWDNTARMNSGAFAYISAQNKEEGGSVICEILSDGDVIKTSQSSGAYTIATCDSSVP